jgi:hypothetical protein
MTMKRGREGGADWAQIVALQHATWNHDRGSRCISLTERVHSKGVFAATPAVGLVEQ